MNLTSDRPHGKGSIFEGDPVAVLILAGGEGRRLGRPKAWLPWLREPLLLAVVRRLALLSPEIFVAARPGQDLPVGGYNRVDDDVSEAGPLAGLGAGLSAIFDRWPESRVAVAACDYPFTDPALFRGLASRDPEADVVLPRWGDHVHPLQAVWRARLGGVCSEALEHGERRVAAVVATVRARVVDAESLTGVDAKRALLNVNDAESLAQAYSLAR